MATAAAPTISANVPSAAPQVRKRSSRRYSPIGVPSVSVCIVNYCQWQNTAELTRQLRRSHASRAGEAEIIVVDNGSPGHPLAAKLRKLPGVSMHRFQRNHGFARAVNESARISHGEWLLLLNPDVSAPAGFLDDIDQYVHRQLRDDPTVGIIGLGVRNSDGSEQPSCGAWPTLRRTLTGLLKPRSRRRCEPMGIEEQAEVSWATGCALLIRRDCFEQLAGFDEAFFLYYEDVDLCRRAAKGGWKVRFDPRIQVRHHTPLHSRQAPAGLRLMTRHALVTYGLKHWPRWQTCILGAIIAAETLVRQAGAWWKGEASEARFHGETRRVVLELLSGRSSLARTRIDRAAQHLQAVAAAQDGRAC